MSESAGASENQTFGKTQIYFSYFTCYCKLMRYAGRVPLYSPVWLSCTPADCLWEVVFVECSDSEPSDPSALKTDLCLVPTPCQSLSLPCLSMGWRGHPILADTVMCQCIGLLFADRYEQTFLLHFNAVLTFNSNMYVYYVKCKWPLNSKKNCRLALHVFILTHMTGNFFHIWHFYIYI